MYRGENKRNITPEQKMKLKKKKKICTNTTTYMLAARKKPRKIIVIIKIVTHVHVKKPKKI